MQQLINEREARAITGGRKPLVPVEYEEACKALVACQTIDEAKYFSDKADALAAWAKIYRDDQAGLEAKRLKLHAYRRMGILAAELRPGTRLPRGGTTGGPVSLLMESGLGNNQARAARRLAKKSEREFEEIVALPRPPSPEAIRKIVLGASDGWHIAFGNQCGLSHMRGFCRSRRPAELARALTADEAANAREYVTEILEWLDEFERHLPKTINATKG